MYNHRSNLILGFHGCDESIARSLLNNPNKIKISKKPYEWLGHGFYFWENNYKRALEWAKDKKKQGKIEKPAVIGAVISLGYCLDLLDSEFIDTLGSYYDLMQFDFELNQEELPRNKNIKNDSNKDLLIRELDCAVIEYMHETIERQRAQQIKETGSSDFIEFDTARGVFVEGDPVYPGAGINKKSHIQICVRNMSSVKGFFLPRKGVQF